MAMPLSSMSYNSARVLDIIQFTLLCEKEPEEFLGISWGFPEKEIPSARVLISWQALLEVVSTRVRILRLYVYFQTRVYEAFGSF
jgi:hypothetical protein